MLLGIVIGHPRLAHSVLSGVRVTTSTDFMELLRELRDGDEQSAAGK
ncbi:MAG: hypothetical protein ACR2MO_04640 [Acidimicrobiales bacterium]